MDGLYLDIRSYTPLPGFAGGHKMTLYAWAKRRAFASLPAAEPRFFDVAADARVLALVQLAARP